MPSVSTRSALKPVGTRCSCMKLRMRSPAATSSMTARVSSATTSSWRGRCRRPHGASPAEAPWPSFSSLCRSCRAARSAGARPKIAADRIDSVSVNSSTPPLIRISCRRGTLWLPRACIHPSPQYANSRPSAPPPSPRRTLSVSSWRTMRPRLAPSAARIASSFCRLTPRDSSRFATLAQAMSSTQATAPMRSASERRTPPTTCSCSGTTPKVRLPLGG